MTIRRRDFLRSGLVAAGALMIGPGAWRGALANAEPGPYGDLQPADTNGLMLPAGFSSRVIATAGLPVVGTSYVWHAFPDGAATFPAPDGGWILVSNSEVPVIGGAGAVRFRNDGSVASAYRVLSGTSSNCAGGPTPWGTWLSCEEFALGRVWECDPSGVAAAVPLPAMGVFKHEAAAVDPERRVVYLTEDESNGRFYRFVPDAYPDLSSGTLQVASVSSGVVTWLEVPDPSAAITPTRLQVPESTVFNGGEGTWYDAGVCYFTTKGDNRVWAYDAAAGTISVIYDDDYAGAPLTGVDNVTVSARSGDIFVAEDGGDLDVVMITPDRTVARLLKVTGRQHTGSELAGPAFDPSGTRFYISSQRGFGLGITYEITGPFRTTR